MINVISSNLRSIGYDSQSATLVVEFHSGAMYQYYGVPLAIYKGLMAARSKGNFLDSIIRHGPYRYQRLSTYNELNSNYA